MNPTLQEFHFGLSIVIAVGTAYLAVEMFYRSRRIQDNPRAYQILIRNSLFFLALSIVSAIRAFVFES
jgi:hypothetical protein